MPLISSKGIILDFCMKFRMPITYKFAWAINLLIVPLLLLLSVLFYWQFRKVLDERVLLQLSSIKQLKSVQIEDYLKQEWEEFQSEVFGLKANALVARSDLYLINPDSSSVLEALWPRFSSVKESGVYDLLAEGSDGELKLALVEVRDHKRFVKLIRPLKIQQILLERTGMGETGETYLVGPDYRLRSLSRFFPDSIPWNITAKTKGVERALSGEEGFDHIKDYRNIDVMSAYADIKFGNIHWAILSELDKSEAYQPLAAMKNRLIVILFLIISITILGAILLSRQLVKPLVKMKQYLSRMASGNYEQQISTDRGDEIGDMFIALDQLVKSIRQTIRFADEIGNMNLAADYRMQGDNDRLGRSLIAMREKLKNLKDQEDKLMLATQKSLLQGQEKERERLSREMHDGLGPLLTSLKMMIQRLDLLPEDKQKVKQTLDETISEVRRMTFNLMPQALVDFGVGAALDNLVKMTSKASGIKMSYVYSMKDARLPNSINIGLYRIAQEAINNSLKHSGASEIKMSLTEFEDRISFYFKDDGHGFDVNKSYPGSGLLNIKERCRILNGSVHIESGKQGTEIEIDIPKVNE